MASKALPSPEVLRQLLRYEPETGKLFWLPRGPEWFSGGSHGGSDATAKGWNARFANQPAFNSECQSGHLMGALFGVFYFAHRVAYRMAHGDGPHGFIDHIDGDPKNNRISNLRDTTRGENNRNAPRTRANTSGVTGVGWYAPGGVWRAEIRAHGERYYLGAFAEKGDAVAARKAAEVRFGFHPNHGRAAP